MNNVISQEGITKTIGQSQDGKFYLQQTFFDDEALINNERIRQSEILDNGTLGLHDNADYRAVISCPSIEQWELFKTQNPETYKNIVSKNEHDRMRGVKQISLLEPSWIVQLRL